MPRPQAPAPVSPELKDVSSAIDSLTLGADRLRKSGRAAAPRIRRILACVDGGMSSANVVGWAVAVARARGARVHAVSVVSPATFYKHYEMQTGGAWDAASARKTDLAAAKASVERVGSACRAAKVPFTGGVVEGFPGHELPRLARSWKADLVVLGSHGHRGVDRLLLGSVADTVKNHAPCSVLIAKSPADPQSLVIAVDGSAASKAAAALGLALGKGWGSAARIVHGFKMPVFAETDEAVEEFRSVLKGIALPRGRKGIQYRLVLSRPVRAILDEAEAAHAGLIVIGSRGFGKVRSVLVGSTSNAVAHEARTSVLIVRA